MNAARPAHRSVIAETIAIGSELLVGGRSDSNSLFITEALGRLGIEVRFKSIVGDDEADMVQVLKTAVSRAGVVIVTGGLGTDGGPAAGSVELARVPAAALTSDAIVHARVAEAPTHSRAAPAPGVSDAATDRLPERGMDPGAVLLGLLGSANLSSRHSVFTQYDSTVGADTVTGPGRGAAVLRVKGTTKGLIASTDGNQAAGAWDPRYGAGRASADAI